MTPSDTAAAATAPMLGGPEPCTREPIHSASNGPPVQTLDVTIAIAQTSAVRSRRTIGVAPLVRMWKRYALIGGRCAVSGGRGRGNPRVWECFAVSHRRSADC